jgi:ADP-ribosylglycohydrolase
MSGGAHRQLLAEDEPEQRARHPRAASSPLTQPQPARRRIASLLPKAGMGWRVSPAAPENEVTRRLDAARGALLGLVLGEQLSMGATAHRITCVSSLALAVAQRSIEEEPHDGTLARTILEHAAPDPRYESELRPLFERWEAGVPPRLAAAQANPQHGLDSDLAAVVHGPAALPHLNDPSTLATTTAHRARLTHADPVAVDAAVCFAAALAAAVRSEDVLAAAQAAAQSGEMRQVLQRAATLHGQRTRSATLPEHFATGRRAQDTVPVALLCAARSRSLTRTLRDVRRATPPVNAVAAMAGALTGARFGSSSIPPSLLEVVAPALHARSALVARALVLPSPDGPTHAATYPHVKVVLPSPKQ